MIGYLGTRLGVRSEEYRKGTSCFFVLTCIYTRYSAKPDALPYGTSQQEFF